ncbi:cupin-like domain-containing protein [Asticcacaulis machinosus]|uniref:Cupin-like domain-containing protein n=1 Tax=Asticcacaulis machinosus TaxID=2984211 RepID=A0ABT5HH64_9CAUL|nr:cupin-like domain-containing protein [Asticcacaulis machinosus]MDC7675446.1 cupin-like domain-containing protein [Asticcacaulis machinosus]
MTDFKSVDTYENVTRDVFETIILPKGQPAILKGLVAHWPCVQKAKESVEALAAYLKPFDSRKPALVSVCKPELNGQFFYNDTMDGFNFRNFNETVSFALDWMLAHQHKPDVEAVYLQALAVDVHLPALESEMDMPLLDEGVPRVWLGNTLRTQTHFDLAKNIACHVAGEKLFTLFPPDQLANLYPGPLDRTPAGVPISMVSMEAPDFKTFPRFRQALDSAVQARLEPGDALYMPELWWHHVQTTGPLNMLVNYWWSENRPELVSPFLPIYMAALSHKRLPPEQRAVWRDMYDYFIFESHGDPLPGVPARVDSLFAEDMTSPQLNQYKLQLKNMV